MSPPQRLKRPSFILKSATHAVHGPDFLQDLLLDQGGSERAREPDQPSVKKLWMLQVYCDADGSRFAEKPETAGVFVRVCLQAAASGHCSVVTLVSPRGGRGWQSRCRRSLSSEHDAVKDQQSARANGAASICGAASAACSSPLCESSCTHALGNLLPFRLQTVQKLDVRV